MIDFLLGKEEIVAQSKNVKPESVLAPSIAGNDLISEFDPTIKDAPVSATA